jgi:uncharacterized protein (TIGR03118 family)
MDRRVSSYRMVTLVGLFTAVLALFLTNLAGAVATYQVTNLVSDIPGLAANTDPNLVNPWGIASSPTSPFWVSDNGTGVATLYNGSGQPFPVASPLVVSIPGAATPTGQVFNGQSTAFNGDVFLFVSEDGTISGWRGALGTTAETLRVGSPDNVYKGTTEATIGGNSYLYAANFRAGTIDVLKGTSGAPDLTGNFIDPNLPSGYAPFDIQNLNGKLYVTYALQDGAKQDDVAGPGNGFVDVFDLNGNLLQRLISNGPLNSPWGLALAPGDFGDFSNDLLVGNFGDGTINAFNPITGAFLGTLGDGLGQPITIEGLWGLRVGNSGNGFNPDTLYFTAGIPGDDQVEDHGLFGSIQPIPEPATMLLLGSGLLGLWGARKKFKR